MQLCSIKGFFHACRETWGSCPSLIPSKAPSSAPNALPSKVPSVFPSLVPSKAPSLAPVSSAYCTDSKLSFDTKTSNGNVIKSKTCKWATSKRKCGFDYVASHCPITCDACDQCIDSKADFYLEKEKKPTTCADIEQNECAEKEVADTCKVTCGSC